MKPTRIAPGIFVAALLACASGSSAFAQDREHVVVVDRDQHHLAFDHRPMHRFLIEASGGYGFQFGETDFAFVSRLTGQKMGDCLAPVMRALAYEGAQLVVLGDGEPAIEAELIALATESLGSRVVGEAGVSTLTVSTLRAVNT